MSDRPDWLPEPVSPPRRPLSERLHLSAVSVASLLLAAFGVVFAIWTSMAAWTVITGSARRFPVRIAIVYAIGALISLGVAYLLRWCLRRERQHHAITLTRDRRP